METTQKKAASFKGIRSAGWVIVICFIIAVLIFHFVLGNPSNFMNNDPNNHPLPGNFLGTIYKGGFIVPVIQTLLLTVIALSIERYIAIGAAFGKGSLVKFVANIKAALAEGDMKKAQQICDSQRGSVANVVNATLKKYAEMENDTELSKDQKLLAIQKELEEATALELPMMEQNLPIIGTITTLGTLMGLLGTVIGMIRSFAALAAGGSADSMALSQGISEALINTAFGILTCDSQRGSVANVVNATLKKYAEMENDTELSKDQKLLAIQKELEEATALELPMMEQNLPIIGTITTLGTLMGLLGTVIGMIRSFAALAAGGSADSMALSQGISEALINTAFGILTGALAVISYNYYTNKIDKLTYSLDEVGFSIVQTFAATHK